MDCVMNNTLFRLLQEERRYLMISAHAPLCKSHRIPNVFHCDGTLRNAFWRQTRRASKEQCRKQMCFNIRLRFSQSLTLSGREVQISSICRSVRSRCRDNVGSRGYDAHSTCATSAQLLNFFETLQWLSLSYEHCRKSPGAIFTVY